MDVQQQKELCKLIQFHRFSLHLNIFKDLNVFLLTKIGVDILKKNTCIMSAIGKEVITLFFKQSKIKQ